MGGVAELCCIGISLEK
jgi:hypothetical protein